MTSEMEPALLPVASILPGNNDRTRFDSGQLDELAASIREHGLMQPITVRRVNGLQAPYQIIAGERRWRACQMAGMDTIPAIVRAVDDKAASALMLIENLVRADLDVIDEANAYRARIADGWSVDGIAQAIGRTSTHVAKRLALLQLVPEAQKLLRSGQLPLAHAECMVQLDHNRQRFALRLLSAGGGQRLQSFRQYVAQLLEEQGQDALWDLTDMWIGQAAAEAEAAAAFAPSGRRALPAVHRRVRVDRTLPALSFQPGEVAGTTLERFIADLEDAGREREARAVAAVYEFFVLKRWVWVPQKPHRQPPVDGASTGG